MCKKFFSGLFVMFSLFVSCSGDLDNGDRTISINTRSVVASDSGSNYGGGWADGLNGGSGFEPWSISTNAGAGSAGAFIGNPSDAGIVGISTTSFSLYANPDASGALVDAVRPFSTPLNVGDTFSVQWGVNWDSGGSGEKGIVLYSGGAAGTALVTINIGGTEDININGSLMFDNYGTFPMIINFELVSSTELRVFANGRDGTETYDNTFIFGSAITPDTVKFYALDLVAGDERQPYFDNLIITDTVTNVVATVVTAAASDIGASSVVLGGEVTSDGGAAVSDRGVVYSTTDETPTIAEGATKYSNGSGTGTFSESIGSLSPSTTYHYNSYAINTEGTSYGTASSFTTLKLDQTISFASLPTKAYGDADFSPGATASSGLAVSYSSSDTDIATIIGGQIHIVNVGSCTITASQSGDATYNAASDVQQTLTVVASEPEITTTVATEITTKQAKTGGNVTSNGGVNILLKGVCYSESENPTTFDACVTDPSVNMNFEVTFTGLVPSTTYHYRAFATNSEGVSYGSDLTFTTLTGIAVTPGQTFAIDENSGVATQIGTVAVTGDVQGTAKFSIVSGNESNGFTIDEDSGILYVADVNVMDYETTPSFDLGIKYEDAENSDIQIVIVTLNNLNDNAPVLNDEIYSIGEFAEPATVVGTLLATDADGDLNPLSYTIKAGNEDGVFALGTDTGILTVADNSTLDYETTPQYVLTVEVSDGLNTGEATVTVNVTDEKGICLEPELIDSLPYTHDSSTTDRVSTITSYGTDCLEDEYVSGDYIYSLDLEAGDRVEIELDPSEGFDGVLLVLGSCGEDENCAAAANDSAAGGIELVNYEAMNAETIFIVVEGVSGATGDYHLEVREWVEEIDDSDDSDDSEVIDDSDDFDDSEVIDDFDEVEDSDDSEETDDFDDSEATDDMDADDSEDFDEDSDLIEENDFDNPIVDIENDFDMVDNYELKGSGCSLVI